MKRFVAVLAAAAAVLALGVAPAHAAPGSAADLLVQRWYWHFLGRPFDEGYESSGRAFWVDLLDRGEEPRRVLEAILSSDEFADRVVDDYYGRYLGRDADADPGAGYWKSGIRADMEPEWVEQNVLASPEYAAREGDELVQAWYFDILRRDGDDVSPGERRYWLGRLAAVGSLNTVREIWYSSEAVERRILDAYDDLLDRDDDEVARGEIDYWYDRAFDTRLGLRIDFATSPGYAPALDPAEFPDVRDVTLTSCGVQRDSGGALEYFTEFTVINRTQSAQGFLVVVSVLDLDGTTRTEMEGPVIDVPAGGVGAGDASTPTESDDPFDFTCRPSQLLVAV